MANKVFANGRELSCKSGKGKSIAAFPDVCMTPPENPATPPGVPVPYPNTGDTADCTSGSATVKISGKEVMKKNKSCFSKSTGDEAGSAAKKGVATSVNRGKVYFSSWSMDVKVEGENAVRHLDLTTHNHGGSMNTGPAPFTDGQNIETDSEHECHNGTSLPPAEQCPGTSHTLLCNRIYCDACIDKRDEKCAGEADAEQKDYDDNRAKDPKTQATNNLFEQLDKANDAFDDPGAHRNAWKGPMFELLVTQAYQDRNDAQQFGFKAHCTTCHVLIEIDVVTKTHIMEVKSTSTGFNLKQIRKYQAALEQCPELAGRRIGMIGPDEDAEDLQNMQAVAKNFGSHGVQADAFVLRGGAIVAV